MTTVTITEKLTVLHCSECSVTFAITESFESDARRKRSTFYCPNGHSQWYPGKTDKQLREEAERQAASAWEDARIARAEAAKAKRELTAAKKSAATAQKRAERGVCPHPDCKRSFVDVARHVQTKHPELAS